VGVDYLGSVSSLHIELGTGPILGYLPYPARIESREHGGPGRHLLSNNSNVRVGGFLVMVNNLDAANEGSIFDLEF